MQGTRFIQAATGTAIAEFVRLGALRFSIPDKAGQRHGLKEDSRGTRSRERRGRYLRTVVQRCGASSTIDAARGTVPIVVRGGTLASRASRLPTERGRQS